MPDDLELVAERADVGSVSDFELEQIVSDALLTHPLLAHRSRDTKAQQQMLHSLRHRPRRGEIPDAPCTSRRGPCRPSGREQAAEEECELIVGEAEDGIGHAPIVGDAQEPVSRRHDLDAIARALLRHHSIGDVSARQRHRAHTLAVGVDNQVCHHRRGGVREHGATRHSLTVPDQVREQHDLRRRQAVTAEERERMRHRDSDTDAEVAERQPPPFGEERVRDRRSHLAS